MNQGKKIVANFIWRLLERVCSQGVTLFISIILARILEPDAYGTIALITSIIAILNVLVDSGLGTALIQKDGVDNTDFSTVFWINILICIVVYIILFISAKYIALFYEINELKDIIRVLGVCIIISGVKNVQQAYVAKHLIFKKFFGATLGGTILSGIIGILFAMHGFGVWALVAQNITNQLIDTIILWLTVKWRPQFVFSWKRFKSLFDFGWKILGVALIDRIYSQMNHLIIGKKYGSNDLAYYNQGYKYPSYFVATINESLADVMLPTLSNEQNNIDRVKLLTRKTVKISTFLVVPVMAGLAACGKPLIKIIFTNKWLPSVEYLQIFCFGFAFYPINTANWNAIKALGRSDLLLKCEIIKKSIGILLTIIAMQISVKALAYSVLASFWISQIVNSWPNKKLLKYSYIEQLKDILPNVLLSLLMFICVSLLGKIRRTSLILLSIQIPIGILIYISGAYFFKVDSFYYLLNIIKSSSIRRKNNH